MADVREHPPAWINTYLGPSGAERCAEPGNVFIRSQCWTGSVERKTLASMALMFAVVTFLLWGTTNFLIGYGEKNVKIDPNLFTAVMWVTMGGLGAGLLTYLWLTDSITSIGSNVVYPVAAGACLGIGILSFVYAMSHTGMSTGATAAVATSNAVFTTMLAFLILREQMSVKEWIGIATVVAGIVILRI